MKTLPFAGNDEYIYDQTTNTLHYCKNLKHECDVDHLTPANSYLIPMTQDNPDLTVMDKDQKVPVRCPHCFQNYEG